MLDVLLCTSMPIFSQNISCTELFDNIESNGRSKAFIRSLLHDSSLLREVDTFIIETHFVVIAKIRNTSLGFQQYLYGQAVNISIN